VQLLPDRCLGGSYIGPKALQIFHFPPRLQRIPIAPSLRLKITAASSYSAFIAPVARRVGVDNEVGCRHCPPDSRRETEYLRPRTRFRSEPLDEVHAASQDAQVRTYVDFTLTNNGQTNLALPVSPHPGDLEPKDPKATYTVQHLALYLTSETGPKAEKRSTVLPGGANLYGQSAFPETPTILKPGESVKFLTRVAVPHDFGTPSPGSITLVANAWLYQETIRSTGDQLKSEEEEIGSATSAERPSALFKRANDEKEPTLRAAHVGTESDEVDKSAGHGPNPPKT
jgi:hypothetical protein